MAGQVVWVTCVTSQFWRLYHNGVNDKQKKSFWCTIINHHLFYFGLSPKIHRGLTLQGSSTLEGKRWIINNKSQSGYTSVITNGESSLFRGSFLRLRFILQKLRTKGCKHLQFRHLPFSLQWRSFRLLLKKSQNPKHHLMIGLHQMTPSPMHVIGWYANRLSADYWSVNAGNLACA
jgi:hypothetical protein